MDCTLAAAQTTPLSIRQTEASRRQKVLFQSLRYPSYRSPVGRCILCCTFNLPNPGQFRLPQGTSVYLSKLSEEIEGYVPHSVKEFPWNKAEDLALQRLLSFSKEAVKWSIATFLVFSFVSDVLLSFSVNKELMMPVGLFTGVTVVQFLKEVSKELHEHNGKDMCLRSLYNIGSTFAAVKLFLSYITLPAPNFFSHLCNGALIQVIWLVKKSQETGNAEESSANISISDLR